MLKQEVTVQLIKNTKAYGNKLTLAKIMNLFYIETIYDLYT